MTSPATGSSTAAQETADDRTLATARVIAAPPADVYAAFVAPERLARWWGPKGFRNTFEVCEPRPGGAWKFVMHGPTGGNYANESVFEELVPGERVAIRHVCSPLYRLTVALTAEGGGTRVTWRQTFDSARQFESVRRFAGPANEENLDRLEAEVARGA